MKRFLRFSIFCLLVIGSVYSYTTYRQEINQTFKDAYHFYEDLITGDNSNDNYNEYTQDIGQGDLQAAPVDANQEKVVTDTNSKSYTAAVNYYSDYYSKKGYKVVVASDSRSAKKTFVTAITDTINTNSYNTAQGNDGYNCNVVVLAPVGTGISEECEALNKTADDIWSKCDWNNNGTSHLEVITDTAEYTGISVEELEQRRITINWFGYDGSGVEVATASVFSWCSGMEYRQAEQAAQTLAASYAGMPVIDQIKGVYDYFRTNMTYDYQEAENNGSHSEAHTPYGALFEKNAVCDGFASAFAMVMENLGIKCNIVVNGSHAWNEINVNGKWYFMDVTSSVGNNNESYYSFLYGLDIMGQSKEIKIFFTDNSYYRWTADNSAYYGYTGSTKGVNSSTITLAQRSYMVEDGTYHLE